MSDIHMIQTTEEPLHNRRQYDNQLEKVLEMVHSQSKVSASLNAKLEEHVKSEERFYRSMTKTLDGINSQLIENTNQIKALENAAHDAEILRVQRDKIISEENELIKDRRKLRDGIIATVIAGVLLSLTLYSSHVVSNLTSVSDKIDAHDRTNSTLLGKKIHNDLKDL